jgi:ABC-2 type transport system permease protein
MHTIILIAKHCICTIWSNKAIKLLIALFAILIIYATITSYKYYIKAEANRKLYQKQVRDSWVNSPDKHPHRMAHYGFIAFRPKSVLSIFDNGIESYTGNAIFLEAHKQNSTNFSEASLSTAMLRFGEISVAMLLQLLLPLLIFFIGFNCISSSRETGTLKMLLAQNVTPKQLIIGNILGITSISMLIVIPAIVLPIIANSIIGNFTITPYLLLFIIYTVSVIAYSTIAVLVSANSKSSKVALVVLIGIWLMCTLLLPKLSQMMANCMYPAPSKIAFETAIEKDIVQYGDSHNPDDTFFKKLKDSVLKANNVTSTQDLNFNYGGFQMKVGEALTATVYNKHLDSLLKIYQQQINVQNSLAFINPFTSTKQWSMAISQTDFATYTNFQQQAEQYRFDLAQTMNDLQIKVIPNKKLADTAKSYSIDKKYWSEFKDFAYKPQLLQNIVKQQSMYFFATAMWLLILLLATHFTIKNFKAI